MWVESVFNGRAREFFYSINYPKHEEELCKMEMKYLFNIVPQGKHFFSKHYVNPSRSPFIKECLSIIYSAFSLEDIIHNIEADKLSYEDFKVCYVKLEEDNIDYEQRLEAVKKVGFVINGEAIMHNPKIILGITRVKDKWIFGRYEKNDYEWHNHDKKPYCYSNALSLRISRAVVNIAAANDSSLTLIDPCCGIGTVLIEALSMGFNIKGYEINPHIAKNAKINLDYFGYEDVITVGDMHNIRDKYDVAIIDIPYGLFTPTTLKEQTDIIKTARRIANKLVIITFEDMEEHITSAGFRILDKCEVHKGTFTRHITVASAQ